jgi:hypothetical protein
MIEVHPKIFVGNQGDYDWNVARLPDWAVVHACKEPYHRQALGYTSRGAPKNHLEYLVARRGTRLILNMVDTDNPFFFDIGMINHALDFIAEMESAGRSVLIHCNQGESRGPSIALLYLAARARVLPTGSHAEAEQAFQPIYPAYAPNYGIREHLRINWVNYMSTSP